MENGDEYSLPGVSNGYLFVLENQKPLLTFMYQETGTKFEQFRSQRGAFDGKHFIVVGSSCAPGNIKLKIEGNKFSSQYYKNDGEKLIATEYSNDFKNAVEVPEARITSASIMGPGGANNAIFFRDIKKK